MPGRAGWWIEVDDKHQLKFCKDVEFQKGRTVHFLVTRPNRLPALYKKTMVLSKAGLFDRFGWIKQKGGILPDPDEPGQMIYTIEFRDKISKDLECYTDDICPASIPLSAVERAKKWHPPLVGWFAGVWSANPKKRTITPADSDLLEPNTGQWTEDLKPGMQVRIGSNTGEGQVCKPPVIEFVKGKQLIKLKSKDRAYKIFYTLTTKVSKPLAIPQ